MSFGGFYRHLIWSCIGPITRCNVWTRMTVNKNLHRQCIGCFKLLARLCFHVHGFDCRQVGLLVFSSFAHTLKLARAMGPGNAPAPPHGVHTQKNLISCALQPQLTQVMHKGRKRTQKGSSTCASNAPKKPAETTLSLHRCFQPPPHSCPARTQIMLPMQPQQELAVQPQPQPQPQLLSQPPAQEVNMPPLSLRM